MRNLVKGGGENILNQLPELYTQQRHRPAQGREHWHLLSTELLYQLRILFAHEASVQEQLSRARMSACTEQCNCEELCCRLICATRHDVAHLVCFDRKKLVFSAAVSSVYAHYREAVAQREDDRAA